MLFGSAAVPRPGGGCVAEGASRRVCRGALRARRGSVYGLTDTSVQTSADMRVGDTQVSVRAVGNRAVPSYVPIRALIKPVFVLCPRQRVVTAAVIPPEKVVEKSPRARHVAGHAMFPSLFFDLFCMKQVTVASNRQ